MIPASSTPVVSVCLPVYNGIKYLEQAINSVLWQSESDLELIIADDDSLDGSWDLIKKMAAQDKRIVPWRNDKRLGLFANYNACIEAARGKYIKLFAQDDLLAPQALEQMLAAFAANDNIALVVSAKRWISESNEVLSEVSTFQEDTRVAGADVVLYNLIRLTNWVGEPSTAMFPREFAGSGFDTDFFHYGDLEYWFRILSAGDLYYLHTPLAHFRRHTDSATTINLRGMYFAMDILRLGEKYRRVLEDLGESHEHFLRRAMEEIALHVDHLVTKDGLTPQELLYMDASRIKGARQTDSGESASAENSYDANSFRLLAFHALRALTATIAELDDLKCHRKIDRDIFESEITNIKKSTSWKLTAPLRSVTSALGGNNVAGNR